MINDPRNILIEKKDDNLPLVWLAIPFGIILGIILVYTILPAILPGLAVSLSGSEPKVFWYLSRAIAIGGYCILWISMMLGLSITSNLAGKGTNRAGVFEIHKFTSLVGLGLASMHALLLLGDQYLKFGLVNILIPFNSAVYRPLWVGLGQVAFYLWLILGASYYVRRQISKIVWRWIHFASFAAFLLALLHGITSGTDSGAIGMQLFYWISGVSLILLLCFRVISSLLKKETEQRLIASVHPPE